MSRLDEAIAKARTTYLVNAPRLVEYLRQSGCSATAPDIFNWLAQVTIIQSERMGNLDRRAAIQEGERGSTRYATAWYREQEIRVNPSFVAREDLFTDADLEDMMLHEYGHLFTHHFMNRRGHNQEWAMVGYIVGYVPFGSLPLARRRAYASAMVTYRMAAALGTPHPELGL